MNNTIRPFHLAIPVNSIEKAREFYGKLLGFEEGRSMQSWVDWDFFGHQLVTHLDKDKSDNNIVNLVDGHGVPVPHFGIVLEWNEWHNFAEKLKSINTKFEIEPYIRFKGTNGEQATMFFFDPFKNALEFKAFKNEDNLFKKF